MQITGEEDWMADNQEQQTWEGNIHHRSAACEGPAIQDRTQDTLGDIADT